MNARAHPSFALRPYLAADAPLLADVFRESIAELTGEDYSPSQQEAWATAADDADAFAKKLAGALTLVATMDGTSPIGFIALQGADKIDMLYVHPAVAGQGIGAMLCDAIEKLATARGAARLTVDASDTAVPFFEKRGFAAQQRNTVTHGDEWLANTTMEKKLASTGARP
jgi:putative acetyltransferase